MSRWENKIRVCKCRKEEVRVSEEDGYYCQDCGEKFKLEDVKLHSVICFVHESGSIEDAEYIKIDDFVKLLKEKW